MREQAEKGERVHRRGALLVIVEVDIDVAAAPLPHLDRLAPGSERCSGVSPLVAAARTMAPQVDEVSSEFPWSGRIMVVGDAERYVSIRQHAKDLWRIPTGMTEFKAVPTTLRKKGQEGTEPARIRREIRRQLKENWPDLVAKNR